MTQEWTPGQRASYLTDINAQRITDRALTVPPATGDGWADLTAADDFFERADRAWDEADAAWREAQAVAENTLRAADAAEAGRLQVARDRLWAARQRASSHRDGLLRRAGLDG